MYDISITANRTNTKNGSKCIINVKKRGSVIQVQRTTFKIELEDLWPPKLLITSLSHLEKKMNCEKIVHSKKYQNLNFCRK